MLLIQAVANTMLVMIGLTFALVAINRCLGQVLAKQHAKIAQAEAIDLDEQLRMLTDEPLGE